MLAPPADATLPVNAARILIVEDEAIIADHIATRLEKSGYSVAGILSSSAETLESLGELTPDLILMDIRIKGPTDGIDTAVRVREQFDIPVIFLTAHTDQETIDRAKRTGAFGFLTKPINHVSLSTSVEMALTRHSSEREIRRHEAWMESLLETLPDGVAVLDRDGRVRFLNRLARELTQNASGSDATVDQSRDLSAVGRHASELFGFPGSSRFWSELLANPASVSNTLVRLPANATIENSGVVLDGEVASSHEGGRFAGFIVTFRDATVRDREERARRQAEKMQALGRLTGNIAHDFNNLLTVIHGYADLIGQETANDASYAALEIMKTAETGARLIGQMMAFARKNPRATSLVKIDALIESSRWLMSRMLGSEVSLVLLVDSTVAHIRGENWQIEQILMNLVVNARDAMPSGGTLTISVANSGNSVLMVVTDTGAGITRDIADRIFEPFFTTKAAGKGTGLGLSIVHGIVTDLGGAIEVESEPGRGAAFIILLPAERADSLY